MKVQTTLDIEYPESDGRPMGETDWHIHWIIRLRDILKHRYRNEQVYVAADLLLLYEEGVPFHFVVPDVMVVKDCQPGLRRSFKIWEEGRVPNAVFEITSQNSRQVDRKVKPNLYERFGVGEYFLYDPTGDYLRPALQGYRLTDLGYEPVAADSAGRLLSRELQVHLSLDDGELVLQDATTGELLPSEAEAEREAFEAERETLEAEREAREAAESELRELREQLRRHGLAE